MLKKKVLAIGLVLLMILQLFGCAAEPEETDPFQKFMDKKMEDDTFVAYGKDAEEMEDPLVICVDLEYVREPVREAKVILNEFLYTLEQTGGLSEVQIRYLPKTGADREIALDRLRVEIMAGSGPDVFIMNCTGTLDANAFEGNFEDPLIGFPEQAIENALFLPLDEYMENNTRFTEWDKQTQAVLAAGRNEEGQQIIPLSYTLPVISYRYDEVNLDLTGARYTWEDMWTDPELSPYAMELAGCGEYMEHVFGELVDFEEEELCFTEEELLQRVQMMLDQYIEDREKSESEGPYGFCTTMGEAMKFDISRNVTTGEPQAWIPMYSDDGGVTATIISWAAINRNTWHPEEAYTVIDILMSERVQSKYEIYSDYLRDHYYGLPMHEDLLHPDNPVGSVKWALREEEYAELCEVRSQITNANFHNELSRELSILFYKCFFGVTGINSGIELYEDFVSVEESVHETYEKMQRRVKE